MIIKKGITLVAAVISVIVVMILAGTITISSYSAVNYATLSTWANEMAYIQNIVDETKGSSSVSVYTNNKVYIDITKLTNEQLDQQFKKENIVDNTIELNILDMAKLKIANTVYGNLKTPEDVYVYSITTGRVYYLKGISIEGETYYTLTTKMKRSYELEKAVDELSSVVFVPSKIGYTNQAVNVKVKVPNKYSDVVVTTNNTQISISDKVVNDKIDEYIVNGNKIVGNYVITVSYNDGTQSYTTNYNMNSYDAIKPVISAIDESNFETLNKIPYVKGITATDDSGIKQIKYALGEINEEDAKEYFKVNGNNVINGRINIKSVDKYTIYAEDNAGNFAVYTFDKMYWNYAIY